MTTRRLLQVALACALSLQVASVVAYGWMTHWTFGATLTTSLPKAVPEWVHRFLDATLLIQHLGAPLQVGDVPSALLSALLDTGAWTLLLFLLLQLRALRHRRVRTRPARRDRLV